MPVELVLFLVRALLRVGQAGKAALEQHAQDAEAFFPKALAAPLSRAAAIAKFFGDPPDALSPLRQAAIAPGGELELFWDPQRRRARDGRVAGDPQALTTAQIEELFFLVALRIRSEERQAGGGDTAPDRGPELLAGAIMVRQWAPGAGPVSPVGRVALTLADIALEYVGSNPQLLGIGGNGEKLLGALATSLAGIIPDDGAFGPSAGFGRRLVGGFLQAALGTLQRHPDLVLDDANLATLVSGSLQPVVAALPQTLTEKLAFERVTQALVGPAANAALAAVAANPAAFLGGRFKSSGAVGALTAALLQQAAATGLQQQFTQAGLLGLFQSALQVAAKRPELFIGGAGTADALARSLFQTAAARLGQAQPPFDADFGIGLLASLLDSLADFAPRFVRPGDAWGDLAAQLAARVVRTLADGLGADPGGALRQVFSRDQLLELGRIFALQLATQPSMLGADARFDPVITAVARSIAADRSLLLSGGQWLTVARAAALAAATDPGRLFALPGADGTTLGEQLLTKVLTAAAAALGAPQQARALLFGDTLASALVIVIEATAGRADAIRGQLPQFDAILKALNDLASAAAGGIGSREWLDLFRRLLGRLLAGLPLDLDRPALLALLPGAAP